jgi:hypothetical protein
VSWTHGSGGLALAGRVDPAVPQLPLSGDFSRFANNAKARVALRLNRRTIVAIRRWAVEIVREKASAALSEHVA